MSSLVFSDQIPFWVKIGLAKVLHAQFEINETSSKKRKKRRCSLAEEIANDLKMEAKMQMADMRWKVKLKTEAQIQLEISAGSRSKLGKQLQVF